MISITSNELKTRGVSAIKGLLKDNPEAAITVRGKAEYVVLKMDDFIHYRELELEQALYETRKEINEGKFAKSSVEEHLKDIGDV
ncbi:MAG: type II toxin-antitoxin system Phd/YefM family antitoxin [Sedimentisphaeraceae bacterium JB056]